jgi:hypothetical protein
MFKILVPSINNSLIWFNAILMLAGIFVFHWQPEVVIIAYFLETIIIGIIHIGKLFIVLKYGDEQRLATPDPKNKLFNSISVIPFFIFHYFFFIFVQSIFIFVMVADILPKDHDSFNVFKNYAYLLTQHDIFMAFLGLLFSNVAMTFKNFILPGEFRRTTTKKLFFQPYLRIFIQQFATIISWAFMFFCSSAFAGAILIILFRLIADLILQAATTNPTIKTQLISSLKKGQKPEDAAKTEESFNSFLGK